MTQPTPISIEQAHSYIAEQSPTIVDVRDASAYQQAAMADAIHLSNDSVQAFLEATPRDKPVIVYCYHGNGSVHAARFLLEQGFTDVMTMEGGFEAWRKQYATE